MISLIIEYYANVKCMGVLFLNPQSRVNMFSLVLWHIDYCRSFNAKSLYTYIKYIISKHILKITFLNKPELGGLFFFCSLLNGFTQFQTIQFSSSAHSFFVYTQLNYLGAMAMKD